MKFVFLWNRIHIKNLLDMLNYDLIEDHCLLQDGEYFLRITQQWEDRLLSHCQQIEAEVHNPSIPEDGK